MATLLNSRLFPYSAFCSAWRWTSLSSSGRWTPTRTPAWRRRRSETDNWPRFDLNNRFQFAASVFASLLVPVIICSVTAMVDASSDGLSHHDLLSYPQMGVFGCFLGSARTNGNLHLLLRPEFIYFFFWIISLMLGLVFDMSWLRLTDRLVIGAASWWCGRPTCSALTSGDTRGWERVRRG